MSLVNLCVFMCKVNKSMHSTVLSESAFLLSSCAIGNILFPTYEVLVTSSLHSFLLKITVNCGLWMLMLSLINFIGSASCERCCSLRPAHLKCSDWLRRMVTPIRASTDQHPTPPGTHGLSGCVFRASEQRAFKIIIIIKNNALLCHKIIVGIN